MARLTTADFDQELLILFDAYVHGDIDRRGFLDRAAKFAVGGMTAAGLLAALSPDFAVAQVVPQGDPRISTQRVDVASPSGSGTVKAYVAQPAGVRRRDRSAPDPPAGKQRRATRSRTPFLPAAGPAIRSRSAPGPAPDGRCRRGNCRCGTRPATPRPRAGGSAAARRQPQRRGFRRCRSGATGRSGMRVERSCVQISAQGPLNGGYVTCADTAF